MECCKFTYTTILPDGHAKTFQYLQDIKVYGDENTIQKEECIDQI